MVNQRESKNEKIAHSYFQLSQIFAIFVGGLLIATGLFFPTMSFRELEAYSGNLCNGVENVSLCELSIHKQINLDHAASGFFFFTAILFGINSFVLWMWGDSFIRGRRINEKEKKRYLILFNVVIGVLIIVLRLISYIDFSKST